MLEQVLRHIHNHFEVSQKYGTFTVVEGSIVEDLDLLEGQYFWVMGSVFNDGLHQHPATNMAEETFTGMIWGLAIPQAVIELSQEIEDWCSTYADTLDSPYQSESFGGYSYSKGSGSSSGANADDGTWQGHFRSRLNVWRKLS